MTAQLVAERMLLSVDGIWKSFGSTPVLQGVSFDLRDKEILGVIGPSGGGKTTLLRCLDLLESIDRGQIDFQGINNGSVTSEGVATRGQSGIAETNVFT